MKDYYKILGVKKNATEEKIRARWIELTKRYHPDRGEDIASDEKIREINEAYQVLKHSSTRVEYDLKRTYGQGKRESKRESKRGSYFKKLGAPASILIIFIILSVIYFKNSQTPPHSELIVLNKTNQINQIDSTTQRPKNPVEPENPTSPTNITIQTNSTTPKTPKTPKTQKSFAASTPQSIFTSTPAVPVKPNPENPTSPTNITIPTNSTNPTISTNITIQTNVADLKPELAQFKPPSLLATEDEVRKFFSNYVERYNRMDIEGFLSLFSLKAVQNQKDGLEGIRKIYTDFFNQGQEVHYYSQDMKIEIYQNVVEVKARYEINQILKKGGEKKTWRGFVRWSLSKENGALKILSLDYQHQKTP